MGEIKLSVILPVYNAEAYLDRAIESILGQTLKEIEIIAIQDGSKDNSSALLKKWKENDSRVRVIDKANEGVSAARNDGIKMARGKYITFVDADDYVEPDSYDKVIQVMDKEIAEASLFGYFSENEKEKEKVYLPWDTGSILTKKEIWDQLIPYMIKVYPEDGLNSNIFGSVWRICVKREKILEQEVFFDTQLAIAEDFDFCIRLYSKLNRITIINECLYHYIRWENTALAVYRREQFREGRENQLRLKAFLEKEEQYQNLEKRYLGSYLDVCIGSLVNYVRPGAPEYRQKIKELREVVDQIAKDDIYDYLEQVPLSRNQKLVLWLIQKKYVRLILLFTKVRQIRKG